MRRDISRFKHPRALTAFAGLDPSVKESGQFKGTRNKISKRGNRQIRRALYMVAMRSVSINRKGDYVNPYLRDFYDRKCRSKPNKVALIAVTHKLIFIIFAVLRDQKPFYWADPKEHRNKINSAGLSLFSCQGTNACFSTGGAVGMLFPRAIFTLLANNQYRLLGA